MEVADNSEGKGHAVPDGAAASNARVQKATGVKSTWHLGPNSEYVGSVNVFGGNRWGDTRMPQTCGYWDQQGNYVPRASQTTLPAITL